MHDWPVSVPRRMRVKLSRRASAQIDAIIRYTDTHFGERQTAEYIDGLYYSFELLSDNPRMGREWASGRRRYLYRSHIVYYRIEADFIFITEIMNERQLPPNG